MNKYKRLIALTCLESCHASSSWLLVRCILLSLSRFRSDFFIQGCEKEGIPPFISTPTASGGSSDKVAARAGPVLGLILWFQFDPVCYGPLRSSSSPIMAVSFITSPIKKDLIE